MPPSSEATRRTGNVRMGGRAARVVERVTHATLIELGRVGYADLRVEDVATRAGVNKTTVYRRWTTKAELVAATLIEQRRRECPEIDTGTVRGDLRASLLEVLDLNPTQRAILRVIQMERSVPEVDKLARRYRAEFRRMRVAMVERGIARGELPEDIDVNLLVDLVSAPVQCALLLGESLDARYVDRVLDAVLAGVTASARKARSRRGAPGKRFGRAEAPRSRSAASRTR